jgi:uncharacterized membrane protein HdeD (DUF308 family)
MKVNSQQGFVTSFHEVDAIHKKWGWFFILGLILMLLGILAIGSALTTTLLSVIVIGVFLIGGGLFQAIQAILAKKWAGFFVNLLLGLLYLVTGFLCVTKPAAAAVSLTLFIAFFFFLAGLFRMITALYMRVPHWGWVFFNGLVTLILGALIFSEWPLSGLWIIGLFVGIDLILAGFTWVVLSLSAKNL